MIENVRRLNEENARLKELLSQVAGLLGLMLPIFRNDGEYTWQSHKIKNTTLDECSEALERTREALKNEFNRAEIPI